MRYLFSIIGAVLMLSMVSGCSGVRVRKGDTLYSIAKRNDIPMRAIIEANDLKPPYILSVGQYLVLPRSETYRVRRGDTLYSIANRHGMSVSSLARLNRIQPPYTIHNGQVLKINSWSNEKGTPIFTAEDRMKTSAKTAQNNVGTVAQDRQAEAVRRKAVKNPTAFQGKANVPKSQSKKKFAYFFATRRSLISVVML